MATAFRSFFRFLFQNGELQANLAAAVPVSPIGAYPQSISTSFRRKSIACWAAGTVKPRLAAATTRFFSCSPVSVSALGKLLLFNSMTLTGYRVRN